jgi:hypothetical protein
MHTVPQGIQRERRLVANAVKAGARFLLRGLLRSLITLPLSGASPSARFLSARARDKPSFPACPFQQDGGASEAVGF